MIHDASFKLWHLTPVVKPAVQSCCCSNEAASVRMIRPGFCLHLVVIFTHIHKLWFTLEPRTKSQIQTDSLFIDIMVVRCMFHNKCMFHETIYWLLSSCQQAASSGTLWSITSETSGMYSSESSYKAEDFFTSMLCNYGTVQLIIFTID